MATTLHLLIPGLLGPWPEHDIPGFPIPKAPALERLLARADAEPGATDADATLFELFGLSFAADQDPPVAAVTRLADCGDSGSDWWLRADPVHLRADVREVFLFARGLMISNAEAGALSASFNRMFAEDGLHLEATRPERWYLRLDHDPGLRTVSLASAIGQDIGPLLPQGANRQHWRALMTEAQMLFHSDPINGEREAKGQASINGIWFWGGGSLPQSAHSPADGVYAADLVSRGLARLAETAISPPPDNADDWCSAAAAEAKSLVVLEQLRYTVADDDPYGWRERVETLEREWFAPCLALLKAKTLHTIYLYPCNGTVYRITPSGLRRFWRRQRALAPYLAAV